MHNNPRKPSQIQKTKMNLLQMYLFLKMSTLASVIPPPPPPRNYMNP